MERQTISPVSYSKDGRFMQIDTYRATQSFLFGLLQTLRSVDSYFVITYTSQGEELKIESRELLSDDPLDDEQFALAKSEELECADFITIEKVLSVPQDMIPGKENTI